MPEKTKYCPSCGKEIQKDMKFCPVCGAEQPNKKFIDNNQNNINLNAPAPDISFGKAAGIYRNNIGFKNEAYYIFADNNSIIKQISLPGSGTLLSQYAVISFENSGILVMGTNIKNKFNGKNSFIPKDEIKNVHFKNGIIRDSLIIELEGNNKLTYKANKFLPIANWQASNLKKLKEIYAK